METEFREEVKAYGKWLNDCDRMEEKNDECVENILPPRTGEQIRKLKRYHNGMYGVCEFCGIAGHVDQLVDIAEKGAGYEEVVEACGDCVEKFQKGLL